MVCGVSQTPTHFVMTYSYACRELWETLESLKKKCMNFWNEHRTLLCTSATHAYNLCFHLNINVSTYCCITYILSEYNCSIL